MNKAAATRAAGYATGAVSLSALLLQMYGLADYDPQTGLIDIKPFSVGAVIPMLISACGNAMAFIAVLRSWRPIK